jgi:2-iminobutanoate/2-iminopropanoate deaminase
MPRTVVDVPAGTSRHDFYSAAVRAGDFIFVAGQGPRDPVTGEFAGATIEEQTELTLGSVREVLIAAGATMDDVVKVQVHLSDINNWDRFNKVYVKFFSSPRPARTTVGSNIGNILVEVDVVAYVGTR